MDASNSMNSKLIADYVELANQHLDNLPIESLEEFDMTVIALENLVHQAPLPELSKSLHGRIKSIQELLSQPELYVAKQEHFKEYQHIVSARILSKINAIRFMTLTEKNSYISDLKQDRELKVKEQERLALQKIDSELKNSADPNRLVSPVSDRQLALENLLYFHRQELLIGLFGLSREEVMDLDAYSQQKWLMHRETIHALLAKGITCREIMTLAPVDFEFLLVTHHQEVLALLEIGVSLPQLTLLEKEIRMVALVLCDKIQVLARKGFKFDLLTTLPLNQLRQFCVHLELSEKLVQKGLPVDSTESWNHENLSLVFQLPSAALKLLEEENVTHLMALNKEELAKKLMTQAIGDLIARAPIPEEVLGSMTGEQLTIFALHQQGFFSLQEWGIPLERLIALSDEKLKTCLSNPMKIISFCKAQVPFDTLVNLVDEQLNSVLLCEKFILFCLRKGVKFDIFVKMEKDLLFSLGWFHKKSVKKLMNLGVSLGAIASIERDKRDFFFIMAKIIRRLIRNNTKFEDIISLSNEHLMRLFIPQSFPAYSEKLLELLKAMNLPEAIDRVIQLYHEENDPGV
jgi:hypothetical protein